jgi:hypothetical protein
VRGTYPHVNSRRGMGPFQMAAPASTRVAVPTGFEFFAEFRRMGVTEEQTGARRAGASPRTAKTGGWLKPIRRGIGASNCATRSVPSSTYCAEPSRSCADSSTRRTTPSESVDSAYRTQAGRSGSSTKSGRGAGVACGRRCATASCCSSRLARSRPRMARSRPRMARAGATLGRRRTAVARREHVAEARCASIPNSDGQSAARARRR